ncbi:MAG TPA: lytic murein transglycosylase, partial [Gammaproteobacteria bacterium]|nr:lytic murein transglycosylase [Gammaproteobacteria bacterium]
YRNSRVDPYRITLGRRAFQHREDVFTNISNQYHVNACFVAAIWGLETSYGRYKGNFPVIQALATLAYNPRRSAYFRNELMTALHMLNDGDVSLQDFKGEWAGASGHCQFMPSTWKKYAAPYNGVGKADIWNNIDDALASIANFLEKNGWQDNQPWAVEIVLPPDFNQFYIGTNITKKVAEWLQLGVTTVAGMYLPEDLQASIIYPEGGPAYLVFSNFKTLLKWNKSNYYAMALGYLAEEICQRKL